MKVYRWLMNIGWRFVEELEHELREREERERGSRKHKRRVTIAVPDPQQKARLLG